MEKYKVIGLLGQAGAGKDTLASLLCKQNPELYSLIISCTTRPIREGEQDGINYHYLTKDQFLNKVKNSDMLEHNQFNNWYYGTDKNALSKDKINIGVFNPQGVRNLMKYDNIDLLTIYVTANDKQRLLRQLNRELNPNVDEIVRRYEADKKDFKNLDDINYFVIHNSFPSDLEVALDEIIEIIDDKFHI